MGRLYKVGGLTIGVTAIGGLQSVTPRFSFENVHATPADGAIGPETISLSKLKLDINVVSSDVLKAIGALTSTNGVVKFALLQSGAATGHTTTGAYVVWTGLGLDFSEEDDATMTLDGTFRDPDNEALTTMSLLLEAMLDRADTVTITPPANYPAGFTQTFPTRMYRPNTCTFVPSTGTDPDDDIPIPNIKSVRYDVAAKVLTDADDNSIGLVAVDIPTWDIGRVSITYRHGGLYDSATHAEGAVGNVLAARLIQAIDGRLKFNLTGRVGGAFNANSCKITGLKFTDYTETAGPEFSEFTLSGQCAYRTTGNFAGAATPLELSWAGTNKIVVLA